MIENSLKILIFNNCIGNIRKMSISDELINRD